MTEAPAARGPTVAGFPTREIRIDCGSLTIPLLVVRRIEDYVDTDELLRADDPQEPPYWAHLWTGSRVLARLAATQLDCRGKRVVDIGCGLGLVGIAAAQRGASSVLFDYVGDGAAFAKANIDHNTCNAVALQADLRHPPFRSDFDYCFAADVTYDVGLQESLAAFMANHLAPAGRAWCVESVRTFDEGFHNACRNHGLQTQIRTVQEPEDGRQLTVRITEVSWP